jgi:oligo-1,6-glucosidase
MQWDASEQAGFTAGTPWLAVNPNHVEINAQAAIADPDSVFHHYRRLIELRHALDVVVDGEFVPLKVDDPQIYAFIRRLGRQELLVVANCSSREATCTLGAGRELVLSNYAEDHTATWRPWEARVWLS